MAAPHVTGVAALIISQTGKSGGAIASALQQATDAFPCGDTSICAVPAEQRGAHRLPRRYRPQQLLRIRTDQRAEGRELAIGLALLLSELRAPDARSSDPAPRAQPREAYTASRMATFRGSPAGQHPSCS